MSETYLCLRCWRTLPREETLFRCEACADSERPEWLRRSGSAALRRVRELDRPWYARLFSDNGGGKPRCPSHPDAALQLFCECHYPLSDRAGFGAGSPLGLGVAGPGGSGKTLLILTMMHELHRLEIGGRQLGIVGLDDTEARFHDLSRRTLDDGVKPEATPAGDDEPESWTEGTQPPARHFSWSVSVDGARRGLRSSLLLAVDDFGGETWGLPRHQRHRQLDRYLDRLGSLVFLIDGRSVAADLGHATEDAWDRSPAAGDRGTRARQWLSRVEERLGRRTRRIDLALVVSKADGLWDHPEWERLHPSAEVQEEDREQLLEDLLRQSMRRDVWIEARQRFRAVKLFAASSIGFLPAAADVDADGRLRRRLAPAGVTRPLEWLLRRRLAGLR